MDELRAQQQMDGAVHRLLERSALAEMGPKQPPTLVTKYIQIDETARKAFESIRARR